MNITVADDDHSYLNAVEMESPSTSRVRIFFPDMGTGNRNRPSHVSVDAAASEILATKPDVILLDHDLGGHDITGADVANALRTQGFSGRILGTSRNEGAQASYCEKSVGKAFDPTEVV